MMEGGDRVLGGIPAKILFADKLARCPKCGKINDILKGHQRKPCERCGIMLTFEDVPKGEYE